MRLPRLALAAAGDGVAVLAPIASAAVDVAARMISGLVVPYGIVGVTSQGPLTYSQGSLTIPADPSHVKLLVEHDQTAGAVGYGVEFRDLAHGMWGRFYLPPRPDGWPTDVPWPADLALAEAAQRLRDGLSCGVQLPAEVIRHMASARGGAVPGHGPLREVSLVSVPAWDDARVGAAASAQLVVSAWTGPYLPGRSNMHCQSCGHVHAPGTPCLTIAAYPPAGVPPHFQYPPAPPGQPAPPAPPGQPAPPANAGAVDLATAAANLQAAHLAYAAANAAMNDGQHPAPAPLATAGAAFYVTGEAPVYAFDGRADGPSVVRDAYDARMRGNAEAAARIEKFNAQLTGGNPASVMALAAVATRGEADLAGYLPPDGFRPDLMLKANNINRPLISRLGTVPISNATPFRVPIEGEFDGVDDHVEGTPHVAEGDLSAGEGMFVPGAISGAWRVSREMVDSTNPAIDTIAVRAMLRDYRRKTEAKAWAGILAAVPDAEINYGIDTLMELREQLIDFPGDDDDPADFMIGHKGLLKAFGLEVDGDGRPMLSTAGQLVNGMGTVQAGWTGINVDGTELVRSARVTVDQGAIIDADSILWGESSVQTFRFDEVEGPGVLKLALWAYAGCKVLRAAGVVRIAKGAAPPP